MPSSREPRSLPKCTLKTPSPASPPRRALERRVPYGTDSSRHVSVTQPPPSGSQ
jgi:hypothetical protein